VKKLQVIAVLLALALGAAYMNQGSPSRHKGESVSGAFDYYLLALSWSPTYCLTHDTDEQCSGKGYGFVLHGLWPQYGKGGWPQDCAQTALTAEERRQGRMLFPSAKLLNHEWKKHGTCSGLGAVGYLDKADKALAAVKIPTILQPSTTPHYLDADEIVQLFRQNNPGMPDNGVVVTCSGPELAEVHVCLAKDLAFTACGKGVRNQCRSGKVRVPGIR
jgi:ribonuclease T2